MFGKKKVCPKCKEKKSLSDFHKDKSKKLGASTYCKSCSLKNARDWQVNNSDKKRAWDREWRTANKQKVNQSNRNWASRNQGVLKEKQRKSRNTPEVKAREAVSNAVRLGKLPKIDTLDCKTCGFAAENYHHESYKKRDWLKVIPLCGRCHGEEHRT